MALRPHPSALTSSSVLAVGSDPRVNDKSARHRVLQTCSTLVERGWRAGGKRPGGRATSVTFRGRLQRGAEAGFGMDASPLPASGAKAAPVPDRASAAPRNSRPSASSTAHTGRVLRPRSCSSGCTSSTSSGGGSSTRTNSGSPLPRKQGSRDAPVPSRTARWSSVFARLSRHLHQVPPGGQPHDDAGAFRQAGKHKRSHVLECPRPNRALKVSGHLVCNAGQAGFPGIQTSSLVGPCLNGQAVSVQRPVRPEVSDLDSDCGRPPHYRTPHVLWAWIAKRHSGWAQQYAAAALVFAARRRGASIGESQRWRAWNPVRLSGVRWACG